MPQKQYESIYEQDEEEQQHPPYADLTVAPSLRNLLVKTTNK
jgi:hypothetical protein